MFLLVVVRGERGICYTPLHVYIMIFAYQTVGDGLCRDGPSEISHDPSTKRLQTQPKRLGWL